MHNKITALIIIALISMVTAIVLLFPNANKVDAQGVTEAYQGYSLYWGDVHWHSNLCDGLQSVNFGYTWARDTEGLDFCGGTSHLETPSGASISAFEWVTDYRPTTNSFNNPSSFITMLGQEWSHGSIQANGTVIHHNIYFRDDLGYFACMPASTITIAGLVQCLEGQGYSEGEVIIAPHHFAVIYGTWNWSPIIDSSNNEDWVRNVELYSKWGTGEYQGNPKPYLQPSTDDRKYAIAALNEGMKFSFTGMSDSHETKPGSNTPEFPGSLIYDQSGLTGVFVDGAFNRTSLFDAMYNRQTYATDGKQISLYVDINSNIMGSDFVTNTTSRTMTISAQAHSGHNIDNIIIVRGDWNGTAYDATSSGVHTISVGNPSINTTWVDTNTSDSFYYVRLTTDDNFRAWSSPIWVSYTPSVIPTPTPAPIVPTTETSGTTLVWLNLLPLGLLAIALWQKEVWLYIVCGLSWMGLGAYVIANSNTNIGSPVWIMGMTAVIIALAVFIGTLSLRRKHDKTI